MRSEIKKDHILMPAAFFMAQGGFSIYFGFLVSYLTKEGMNSTTIGFVLMLCALFNLFSQPLMGFISDTYFPSKRILLTTVAISIPLSFVLPATVSIPVIAVLSIILMAMIEYSFCNLFDTWIVGLNETGAGIHFSFAKGMASCGYALMSLIVGKILARVGTGWMFFIHAVVMVLLFLLLLTLEEAPCKNKRGHKGNKSLSLGKTVGLLSRNRRYMLFMIAYVCVNVGFRFILTFYPLLIELKGGDEGSLGVGIFLCSLSEIPFIFLFSKLSQKITTDKIMLFSFVMFAVKNLFIYLAPNVLLLQLAQLLQGPSLGLYLPAVVLYMREITPRQISSTALMLSTAVTNAVSSVAGNFLGGILIDGLGIYPSIFMCIMAQALGALIFFVSLFLKDKPRAEYTTSTTGTAQ